MHALVSRLEKDRCQFMRIPLSFFQQKHVSIVEAILHLICFSRELDGILADITRDARNGPDEF